MKKRLTPKKSIKIVLSGSGTLYPLHVGALNYLTDEGYEIESITGVSGGAIVAAAFASGYKGEDLVNLVLETLPSKNKLIDWNWCPFRNWGLIKGNRIETKMRSLFKPTFGDTEIPLKVFACNIDNKDTTYGDPLYTVFSSIQTPTQDIASAVRASMSIPLVFNPKVINGHRYIDGGVAANFPVSIYGNEGEGVVGFHVRGDKDFSEPKSLSEYIRTVIDIMMGSINREHINDAQWAKTVLLNTTTGNLNFKMTEEDALALIEEGYQQAKASDKPKNVLAIKNKYDLVYDKALQTFHNENKAKAWMGSKNAALGNITPLELITNGSIEDESCITEICDVLGRIDHGVYS